MLVMCERPSRKHELVHCACWSTCLLAMLPPHLPAPPTHLLRSCMVVVLLPVRRQRHSWRMKGESRLGSVATFGSPALGTVRAGVGVSEGPWHGGMDARMGSSGVVMQVVAACVK